MPSFRYTAITTTGERVAGVLAGGTEQAVLTELETRRLVPVNVTPVKESGGGRGGRRVPLRPLATSYTQMADLLRAGVPLMRALKLLAGRKSSRLAGIYTDLADAVAAGSDLAAAMESRPDAFSRVHVAMVRAGEKGGFLEQVLARLGQFLHAQADLRSKVVGSLIYPIVLIVVGVLVLAGIFGFIIPKFKPLFAKIELGPLTRSVLWLGDFFASSGWIVLLVGAVAGVAVWRVVRAEPLRPSIDAMKVRVPVLGPVVRLLAAARFCRVLGTMLANSVPMLTAMQIARDAAGNAVMEGAIDKATEAVRQGQPLAPPLGECGLFGDDVIEMVTVGESANNLDDVLVSIADTLEGRLDRQLSVAVRLIEPLMLLLLATVIGLVAIALVVPMTRLGTGIGG
jgi:general secretion pathway protein F/type IV pilus assembly protein PilC